MPETLVHSRPYHADGAPLHVRLNPKGQTWITPIDIATNQHLSAPFPHSNVIPPRRVHTSLTRDPSHCTNTPTPGINGVGTWMGGEGGSPLSFFG